ncbi:MAG: hypothetical protein HKN34_05660, partial [Gammaproteobacteria bacterium]|nr:hypothetical protein [Gammaproteobacteria bacterium]
AGHYFTSIAYSQDGLLLATASGAKADNYPVRIFNMPAGTMATSAVDSSDPHIDFVTRVSFTPDGQVLVTSSADRSIKLWQVATGALIRTIGISDYFSGYETHYVDTSGQLYAARSINPSSEPRIEILSIPDATLIDTIANLDGNALAVNNDRTLLAVAKTTPNIPDWSVNTIRMWRLDRKEFQNCLFDAKATRNGNTPATRFEVKYYSAMNSEGQEIMYSVPCGETIPVGGNCTCNCVEGAYEPDFNFTSSCSINLICTCIPVSFP